MTGSRTIGKPSANPFSSDIAGPNRISKITVNYGEIIDALTITYWTPRGDVVKHHGGDGGTPTTIFLTPSEIVAGLYGTVGFQSDVYGDTSFNHLQIAIWDASTGLVRVEGPFATKFKGEPFALKREIHTFSGYLTDNKNYIQALTFQ